MTPQRFRNFKFRQAIQKGVAVVKFGTNKTVNKNLSSIRAEVSQEYTIKVRVMSIKMKRHVILTNNAPTGALIIDTIYKVAYIYNRDNNGPSIRSLVELHNLVEAQ